MGVADASAKAMFAGTKQGLEDSDDGAATTTPSFTKPSSASIPSF